MLRQIAMSVFFLVQPGVKHGWLVASFIDTIVIDGIQIGQGTRNEECPFETCSFPQKVYLKPCDKRLTG